MTKKKHKPFSFILITFVILAIASAFAYFYVNSNLQGKGPTGETVMVLVEEGDLLSDVSLTLQAHDLIGQAMIFETYAKLMKLTDFKVGVYKVDKGWDALAILTYLNEATNAEKNDVALTIIPGDWAKDVALAISEVSNFTVEEILTLWNDKTYLATLDAEYEVITPEIDKEGVKVLLEGYLMPETYFINPNSTIEIITKRILDQTESFYIENKASFDSSSYSIHEIFTLASVVQFEASKAADMKMVAQVFYNRLNKPMRLQSNVTICYSLYNYTDWKDCEGNKDIVSPYNTYLHDGLPLGPIDNPSATAILSTLNPTMNDYYFFIADVYGDGTVYYAKTYDEHLKNVAKYLN
ncbi:MAG: endolytic transglycosylase MltG [Erysipelotrichaceae bacterium]|nr:endolytic transglycosylase MltG [Erysipelotrichaceae bacterium]